MRGKRERKKEREREERQKERDSEDRQKEIDGDDKQKGRERLQTSDGLLYFGHRPIYKPRTDTHTHIHV